MRARSVGYFAFEDRPSRGSSREDRVIQPRHQLTIRTGVAMPVRRPAGLENILLKPYLWRRPGQLLRRAQRRLSGAGDPLLVKLPWGATIECHPWEAIGSALDRTGVFEIATTELLVRLLDPGEVAVDVGANIGYMTSLLAARAGATGRVLAFEPNPYVYETLVRNVARLSRPGMASVEPSQAAISDEAGTAELILPEPNAVNLGTGRIADPSPGAPARHTVTVATVSLDQLLLHDSVGLLKIDVEGHEDAVLRGAQKLLRERRIRDVVFEDHNAYPSTTTSLLEDHGYSIFAIVQRPLGVRVLPPETEELHRSWDAPMRLATADPARAEDRVRRRGWRSLGRAAFASIAVA